MYTMRQLLRQPIKYIVGILVISLAVAVLLTGVCQYIATILTRAEIEDNFNSVALYSTAGSTNWDLNAALKEWVDGIVKEPPEIVKTVSHTGLLSAYIPALEPDNYTQHYATTGNYLDAVYAQPYGCAILVVTLETVGEDITEECYSGVGSDGASAQIVRFATMRVKGRVNEVISLQEGFHSPVGYAIELTVKAADEAALRAMQLTAGQQYLVYGMNYFDNDWLFRRAIAQNELTFSQPFDENRLHDSHPLGEAYERTDNLGTKYYYYEHTIGDQTVYKAVSEGDLFRRNSCRMTVCDYASLSDVVFKMDDNHHILGFELLTDQRVLLEDENSNAMLQKGTTLMETEAYKALYSVPTMVRVDGDLQELLDTQPWRKVLETAQINHHAFPVLAVDKLGYQAEFARKEARLVSGRDFTQTELTQGAKVCILSETVAIANGITVGDTICLQTYAYDPNINEDVRVYPKTAYPDAAFYSPVTGMDAQQEYTVIGLYRMKGVTTAESSYGFTNNTVFIPKTSTGTKMVMGTEGVLRTIVVHNGKMEEFKALAKEARVDSLLAFYDQGYTQVVSGMDKYETVSQKAALVCAWVYLAILLLFLFLYPGRQKGVMKTMEDLGAPRYKRYVHILVGTLGYLLPGTLLGAVASTMVQEKITEELMKSVDVAVSLADTGILPVILVTAVHMLLAVILTGFYGIVLTQNQKIQRK